MTDDNITTCQVINKHDEQLITLFTEWLDSGLKITIFSESSIPLIGQMKLTDVDTFAKNLSKTRIEYLELTRSVLSGTETSIEFILKDLKFRWKKGLWNHGIVDMAESKMEEIFPGVVKKLLLRHLDLEKKVDGMRKENEDLRITQKGLNDKLEEIITMKNELEGDLYKRFIVVLNSKKERIRELKNELDKKNGMGKKLEDRIYEAETDQSEEDAEDETNRANTKGKKAEPSMYLSRIFNGVEVSGGEKFLKRQISGSEENVTDSEDEDDTKIKRNYKYAKGGVNESRWENRKTTKSRQLTPVKASTSRHIAGIDENEDEGKKNTQRVESMLNLQNQEESEEDIFADSQLCFNLGIENGSDC